MELEDAYQEPIPPHWECQECGYISHRAMSKDRNSFYRKQKAYICPRCRSEGLVPVGY